MASKKEVPPISNVEVTDEDAPGPPISVPDSADTGEGGKLRMIGSLLRKCLGVKDIAAMRLSLPASLLEPIPNLEYWQYLDRPDLFAAINDSDDNFLRMLAVCRFTFTKDLKFIHGKICKPYNSVLGEHFRAHWDVIPVTPAPVPTEPPISSMYTAPAAAASVIVPSGGIDSLGPPSETASIKSGRSSKSIRSTGASMFKGNQSPSISVTQPPVEGNINAQMSNLSLGASSTSTDDEDQSSTRVRIVYLTEQVSHHPPVSAYYAVCPARHLELTGVDQIAAKVSGTTLKVSPGTYNKGIYVKITGGNGEGEQYHITHPVASVNGILRGSFYLTVGDTTIITQTAGKGKLRYRTILEYKEEGWISKAVYKVEGIIHTYEEGDTDYESWTKIKSVPKSRIVAYIDGSWRHLIRWKLAENSPISASRSPKPATNMSLPGSRAGSTLSIAQGDGDWGTLVDLSTLKVIPKTVRPLEKQHATESRKLWEKVTSNLLSKEFSDATKEKVNIEQRQRDEAAERKRKGEDFVPKFFKDDWTTGIPSLTDDGKQALKEELDESSSYNLETAQSGESS